MKFAHLRSKYFFFWALCIYLVFTLKVSNNLTFFTLVYRPFFFTLVYVLLCTRYSTFGSWICLFISVFTLYLVQHYSNIAVYSTQCNGKYMHGCLLRSACSPADFSCMTLLEQVCELFETRWVGIKLGQSREERECGACRGCEGLGPEFFIDP